MSELEEPEGCSEPEWFLEVRASRWVGRIAGAAVLAEVIPDAMRYLIDRLLGE